MTTPGEEALQVALWNMTPEQVYHALRQALTPEHRLALLALLLHDHPIHDLGVHDHSHDGALSGPMAEREHDHLHSHRVYGVTHKHPHLHPSVAG